MAYVTLKEDGDSVAVLAGSEVVDSVRLPEDLEPAFELAVAKSVLRGSALDGDVEREVAAGMSGRVGVRKAADDSLIVAWFPWDNNGDADDQFAETLAGLYKGPGAVAKEDLHVTLLYLGDPAAWDLDLVRALVKIESTRWSPLEGVVGGVGRFVLDGDQDCLVALLDCPSLVQLRDCIRDALFCYGACKDYTAWDASCEHGYLPHVTIGYVNKGQGSVPALSEVIPFCLCALTVAAGPDRATFQVQAGLLTEQTDYAPYVRSRELTGDALAVLKAGRVLSGKHLQLLQDAHNAMGKVIDAETARTEQRGGVVGDEDASHSLGGSAHAEDPGDLAGEDGNEAGDQEGGSAGGPSVVTSLTYAVTKAEDNWHYTFGPLYAPGSKDAHGEWTDGDTLQRAVHEYVQDCVDRGDNRLNTQHGTDASAGRWVEVCAWPYETTVKLRVPGEDEREVTLPAGTVYMGVKWEDTAWDDVKNARLQGLSMGGQAIRVVAGEDLPPMGDKLASRPVRRARLRETELLAGLSDRLLDIVAARG